MRLLSAPLFALMLAGAACSPPQPKRSEARRDSSRTASPDDNSAARKAGHAAYGVAQESKKLAAEAGRKLRDAGKEAHQGWKDAERENRDKRR